MPRTPVDLPTLIAVIDDPRSAVDLADYFEPDRAAGTTPRYSGSRFEFLAGGGDRPDVANVITAEDLVAVTMLSVEVPGTVALQLLEGGLGRDLTRHLVEIPTDVPISSPLAAALLDGRSHADVAWSLLQEPRGMGWVITNKLLARKRPQLIPVYDGVVACAYGAPAALWQWLVPLFADGVLAEHLLAAREEAGVPAQVSALRVLDVIVWMRHRPDHHATGCPGPSW
jgi:hypothetical protein